MMMLLKRGTEVEGGTLCDVLTCISSRLTYIQCHVLSADCPYCVKGQQTKSLRWRPRLSTTGRTLMSSSSAVALLKAIGTDSWRVPLPLLVVSAATSSRNSSPYWPVVVTA